ncbi:hypothetical protein FSS13T_09070 [Flavobacterium saliperosum S13]|uniref:Lipoprotein n=2 Tax=Flavobacterium saliperosum TaxID=329186 RepID=A0A1G4VVU2_9FLAO|nr:hypothetical protein [Flavobacterium saliperosum]ESU26742.1 hypothetical protein FSS13T_09070 [Flavobacterium saliperosum S13]SCX12636.1 hypothetical protein SAMN02927925_01832 [Flavobacterium saliperosum]
MAPSGKHKWLCYLLTMSLLFGSCHVYQKIPVPLEEVAVSNQRLKITTVDNKKRFFKRIEKTDSTYYGLEESGLNIIKKEIKKEEIQQIQIINKPKSRLLTIAGVTVTIGLLVALITSSGWSTGAGPVGGF